MKPAQIAVIGIAAVAAIGLAIVVRLMWPSSPAEPQKTVAIQAEASSQVLVASADLSAGHRLTEADLGWKAWPSRDLNPLYIVDGTLTQPAPSPEPAVVQKATDAVTQAVSSGPATGTKAGFVGAVVRETILKGEPIVERKLVRAGDAGYLAAFLEPGMKAMALKVNVESAAGGFILPGDRVDVILSRKVKDRLGDGSEQERNVVTTVMRNLQILAVDQAAQRPEDAMAMVGATATVAVSAADAEVLALARAEGELSLVLRSYADAQAPSGRVPGAVSAGGRRAIAPRAEPQGRTVTVYRQVQPEVVTVS